MEARLWYKTNEASRWADWGGGQTEMYTEENVWGILANLGYIKSFSTESRLKVDAGFDWRTFDSDVQDWNTNARVRTSVNSDDDYTFNNFGAYLKANYDMNKYLRFFGGIRHDLFTGDTDNQLTGESRDMDDYNVTTYKTGIIGNITDRYSIYANIGSTFTLPKKELKYAKEHPDETDLLFREIGLKANPFDWLFLRYAYYYSDDDIVAFVAGDYVDQGQAIRQGHEIEVNIFPFRGLTLFTSLTLDDSKFDGGPYDGNLVTTVPKHIWNVGIQYDSPFGAGGRFWYRDVGKWYTDQSNKHSYGGYETADLTLYYTFARKWMVAFDLKNLFDEEYAEFVGYWSGTKQYMSSNPRAYYVSLRYNL
jgi:iron complex outermembrane receptor protein